MEVIGTVRLMGSRERLESVQALSTFRSKPLQPSSEVSKVECNDGYEKFCVGDALGVASPSVPVAGTGRRKPRATRSCSARLDAASIAAFLVRAGPATYGRDWSLFTG